MAKDKRPAESRRMRVRRQRRDRESAEKPEGSIRESPKDRDARIEES